MRLLIRMSRKKLWRNVWINQKTGEKVKRLSSHQFPSYYPEEPRVEVKFIEDGYKFWMTKTEFDRDFVRLTKANYETMSLLYD
jgi:hypothetical protein